MNDSPLPPGYYVDEPSPGLWKLHRSDGSLVASFLSREALFRYARELKAVKAEFGNGKGAGRRSQYGG